MRRLLRVFGLGLAAWLVAFNQTALAFDQIPTAPDKPNPTPADAGGQTLWGFFSSKTPYEFWLTCAILAAGLAFVYLAITFLRQIHRQQLDSATRAMTILFVIIATMVLITAGYNNEQIALAFGLFGTIVGYILGRGAQQPAPDLSGAQAEAETAPTPPASPDKEAAANKGSASKRRRG